MKEFKDFIVEKHIAENNDVDKVLDVIASLAKIKTSDLEDGKRVTIGGFPANIKDEASNGTIDLIAVDGDAAKGIKGALMKAGLKGVKIHKGTTVYVPLNEAAGDQEREAAYQAIRKAKKEADKIASKLDAAAEQVAKGGGVMTAKLAEEVYKAIRDASHKVI